MSTAAHPVADPGDPPTLLPALAGSLGHLLWRARMRVLTELAEVLPPAVDANALPTLLALADASRSQQEIADLVSLSRTTIGRVAGQLVAEGLVVRVRNPDDRRSYLLSRTPAGADAVRRWRQRADDLDLRLTAGLSDRESEDLRRLLQALVADELSPDIPAPLLDSLGFLITRAHAGLHADFAAELGAVGLGPRHYGTLLALTDLGPVPQTELARQLGASGARIVAIVDELEARGCVERRRPPSDRRTQVLHLTAQAPALLASATAASDRTLADRSRRLGRGGLARLTGLLARFATAR